jgi:NADH-quinone oxidoreductase subunit J
MAENAGTLFQWLIFLGAAFVSIVGSVMVITQKNPIHSALFLALTLICGAVLYLLLYSPFIAILQVFVYAGAIVMLIVFVIMLLNLEEELRTGFKLLYSKVLGGLLAAVFFGAIAFAVTAGSISSKTGPYTPEKVGSNVRTFGQLLITQYLFPFEIASILLVVAMVGAVVLARKRP